MPHNGLRLAIACGSRARARRSVCPVFAMIRPVYQGYWLEGDDMRFCSARVVMLGIAAICLTRWAHLPTVVAQQVKSQWDAIYSEPQATRGQALYVENCANCHASTLAGTDAAPALRGAAFVGK